MPETVYQPLKGTALFRVQSKKRLAELLLAKPETLKRVTDSDDLYNCWSEAKKNGGTRDIEAPYPHLKTIQKRIANLLLGIKAPDYLMAPVKKRSYVTNAARHIGSRSFQLLDIKDFFPSCTEKKYSGFSIHAWNALKMFLQFWPLLRRERESYLKAVRVAPFLLSTLTSICGRKLQK